MLPKHVEGVLKREVQASEDEADVANDVGSYGCVDLMDKRGLLHLQLRAESRRKHLHAEHLVLHVEGTGLLRNSRRNDASPLLHRLVLKVGSLKVILA